MSASVGYPLTNSGSQPRLSQSLHPLTDSGSQPRLPRSLLGTLSQTPGRSPVFPHSLSVPSHRLRAAASSVFSLCRVPSHRLRAAASSVFSLCRVPSHRLRVGASSVFSLFTLSQTPGHSPVCLGLCRYPLTDSGSQPRLSSVSVGTLSQTPGCSPVCLSLCRYPLTDSGSQPRLPQSLSVPSHRLRVAAPSIFSLCRVPSHRLRVAAPSFFSLFTLSQTPGSPAGRTGR